MKILNFKNLVENPQNIKSGEFMSVDSAVWYIEAALNNEFTVLTDEQAALKVEADVTDSITIELEKDIEELSVSKVAKFYKSLKKEIDKKFKEYNFDVKYLYIIDIKVNETGLVALFTTNYANSGKYIYNITKAWQWAWDYGSCDGTVEDWDLTKEIKKWIHYNRPVLARVNWTNVGITSKYFYYDPRIPEKPIWDISGGIDLHPFNAEIFNKCGFEGQFPPYYYCASISESTYWAQKTNNAINIIEDNALLHNGNPAYKYICFGNFYGFNHIKQYPEYPYNVLYVHLLHKFYLKYGIPVSIPPSY